MKRNILFNIIKIILTLLILFWIWKQIELETLLTSFINLNWLYWSLALFLISINFLTQFARWRQFLIIGDKIVSWKEVIISVLASIAWGMLTPGRVGEMGRILYITNRNKLELLSLALAERLLSLIPTLILGILAGAIYLDSSMLFLIAIILSIILIILSIKLHWSLKLLEKLIRYLPLPKTWQDKVQELIIQLRLIKLSETILILIYSFLFNITFNFQLYLLIIAQEPLPFTKGIIAIPLIFLAIALLPISFGNIGIREAASVLFLTRYGISKETAVVGALWLFTINVLLPSIIGSLLISKVNIQPKKHNADNTN